MALPFGKPLGLLLQPRALGTEPLPLVLEPSSDLANALRGRRDVRLTFGELLLDIGSRAETFLEVVVERSGMECCFPQRRLEPLELGGRFGKDALALAAEIVLELPQSLDLSRQPFDLLLRRAVTDHAGMIGRYAARRTSSCCFLPDAAWP